MAGQVSRENGTKGGRPKGSRATHTLQAQEARAALIRAYCENIQPINEALINKAKKGDIQAIRELHERVYGRPSQSLNIEADIGPRVILLDK
jgi:hypothetical protein